MCTQVLRSYPQPSDSPILEDKKYLGFQPGDTAEHNRRQTTIGKIELDYYGLLARVLTSLMQLTPRQRKAPICPDKRFPREVILNALLLYTQFCMNSTPFS